MEVPLRILALLDKDACAGRRDLRERARGEDPATRAEPAQGMKLNPNELPDHIRKLNPQLFGLGNAMPTPSCNRVQGKCLKCGVMFMVHEPHVCGEQKQKKRLRQDSKPLLNKLETEFFNWLKAFYPSAVIRPQAKRYRLANGIWYKPDFTAILQQEWAWEVKGPHAFRGGFENLKVAAATYPEIKWTLVWKQDGRWEHQEILP